MVTVQTSSATSTAQRLRAISELYQQGMASEFMDRTLDKLLAHEADQSRAQLRELDRDLGALEARHGLSSETFYARYQSGQTDDRMDFVEWASLVQMRDGLRERLQIISGEPSPAA